LQSKKLAELKEEMERYMKIVVDFNIHLLVTDRSRQHVSKILKDLNHTFNQNSTKLKF
jgi:hypothetical protein